MQSSPSSENALLGCQGKNTKKRDFQPCKISGCPHPDTHPMKNCWAPSSPKHDLNRQRKSNRRGKERVNNIDDDENNEDDGNLSMNIHIDRSFIVKQSDSTFLYSAPADSSRSSSTPQAYLAKGQTPIIIDSGTTSHILTKRSDFNFLDKDDTQ